MIRYAKSTETMLDRTLKTLKRLQKDRQKEAEIEAKREASEARKTGLRNEPSEVCGEPSKELVAGSYVRLCDAVYEVTAATGNTLTLTVAGQLPGEQSWEVAAAPENAA